MSLSNDELRFLIMEALHRSQSGERHGWGIFTTLREEGGLVPHTTVYRTLDALELDGFVVAREGAPSESRAGTTRRYFKLTDEAGKTELDRLGAMLELSNKRLRQALQRLRGVEKTQPVAAPVQRRNRRVGE
jgi:DNA-binding PadR family transcriptional regulator